jgi:hypothetical protein
MTERGEQSIPVMTESEVAGWVRWCAGSRSTPLAALDVGGLPHTSFIADELLVDSTERNLVKQLVDRHGAEIVPEPAMPDPPEGLGPQDGVDADAMPLPVRLRLSNPPPASPRAGRLLHDAFDRPVSVTGADAAGLLGLVAELADDGRGVGLNVVGTGAHLPLATASDWNPIDPFAIAAYAGRARVGAAWQLVEAFRRFRSVKPLVTVGILDGGFWLDGRTPAVAPGQPASDVGAGVMQLNLLDESVGAGGGNPNKCGGSYSCPWHGNGVASIATAPVGNGLGAAGVGGTVAKPVLFKTELSISQVFRCLQVCLAWGVDVLNMSWTKTSWELVFPTSAWNNAFQFAADNRLILVAAAGNGNPPQSLPDDDNPRPATRTPGTITVGALDPNGSAAGFSNYGSSVDIWAPGVDIPVMPDFDNPQGKSIAGTSAAAPFVSGVIAMMRAVAPSIDTFQAKQLLQQSGWTGTGRVTKGLDAFAAVLAAMGGHLPDDDSEANDTPQTARALQKRGPAGQLGTFWQEFAALSRAGDKDWYRFDIAQFSRFDLQLRSYPLLGSVLVTLEPDDASSRAVAELTTTHTPGLTRMSGTLAPGGYKLFVHGSINLYEMTVDLADAPVAADAFEKNNSFESATAFRLPYVIDFGHILDGLTRRPGSYDLTLHTPDDVDFLRVETGSFAPLSRPIVRVAGSDAPIDITLYDADRRVIQRLAGVRSGELKLPVGAVSFVEISGSSVTRYRLTVQAEIDQSMLPGPLQEQPGIPVPDLGDPPFRVDDRMHHVVFEVDAARRAAGPLIFGAVGGKRIMAEVLDASGAVIATALPSTRGLGNGSLGEAVEVDVPQLQDGTYAVRLSSAEIAAAPGVGALNVEVLPVLRG